MKPRTREQDAARKRSAAAAERDLIIPKIANVRRRRACLADPYKFFPTYFPSVFYQPFTVDRREMVDAIIHAAIYGGDQAVAGPRADGKTRVSLFGALLLCLRGELEFPLIISKSGPRANRELKNLKEALRDSDTFAADFPEVAVPIRALGGWSSRARQQTAHGEPTNMEWAADVIILPTIDTATLRRNKWHPKVESAARGQIIASLGIEGPIRGYSVRNKRPDLAILDDIDDRESAGSDTQTETRERIIEEDVGGLAGPDKTISRVMLCTLINRTCNAATYTDRTTKPSWRGQRHKLLEKKPDREDLWEEYVGLRQSRAADDPDARVAHTFYMERREAMDAGAVVTNPYRFDSRQMPDGQPAEASALQACYNLIADRGWEHFATEYQNDPPEETGPVESGITPHRVQRQLSGYARRQVPPKVTVLTCGIDVRKVALHWVVCGWETDATGYVIDYGVHEVLGTVYGSDAGLDMAVQRAILARLEESKAAEYMTDSGEILPVGLTLVDAGWRTDAVYAACATAGVGVMPVMGFGKSSGCTQANFYEVQHSTRDKKPGDGWFLSRKGSVWLVAADTDRWKAWSHDRWMTAPGKPGCMQLFGTPAKPGERLSDDEKLHHSFSRHICNEVETEELIKGTLQRRWKAKSENTHWLDASYYAAVAASMKGIRLPMQRTAKTAKNLPGVAAKPQEQQARPSLAALAKASQR